MGAGMFFVLSGIVGPFGFLPMVVGDDENLSFYNLEPEGRCA
jgi:hypothetical protein